MSALGVLLRKELHATFTSPIAYVVSGVFLLVAGYTFALTLFFTKVANLIHLFHQVYVLLVLLTPVITMRAFAEERRSDTLELLLTAPVREIWIVLAKYLSAMALVATLLLLSFSYALILQAYGAPDLGPIYGGYVALLLLASLLVAVGAMWSSLTENQVVAASASLGTFLMLWFADSVAYVLPAPVDLFFVNASLLGHFAPMSRGSLFLSDVGYYVTGTLLALFLTTRVLADR
jgi:ABC-2 type transport system permease protein